MPEERQRLVVGCGREAGHRGDVVLLPLKAVLRVVAAGPVAPAVQRIGGHAGRERAGHQLPVPRGGQRAGAHHQGRPITGHGDRDLGPVGRGNMLTADR